MITQQIKLNLIPGQVFPRVNASQYDSGTRTLQMALYNGDQVFNIASGMTAVVQGTKPDRTGFQYAATITEGSNIATLDITQQMTAVKGDVICELVISNGNNRIATVNFILSVEAAALSDDTVISETDLPLIEEAAELAERIDGIVQQVDEDAQTASNAATAAQRASEAATTAQDAAEESADKAEAYGTHPPYIGANGNWYVYNVTTQQYEDSGVKAQGPLSGLTDVEISNPAENDIIAYDATAQKWKNGQISYANISGKPTLGSAAAKDSTDTLSSGSTDLIESGAVHSAIQTLTNQVEDAYEVMGQNGAKNLLPNNVKYVYTSDGITFTPTSDGGYKVYRTDTTQGGKYFYPSAKGDNPTARRVGKLFLKAGTYIAVAYGAVRNVCYAQIIDEADTQFIADNIYDAGREFTLSEDVYVCPRIRVIANKAVDTTIKFMICPKSWYDVDPTYQPYAKTNQQLTEDTTGLIDNQNVNGAVNMCKNEAVTQTTSDGITTLTWTVNDDNTVTITAPSYPVTLASSQYIEYWKNITADECSKFIGKRVRFTGCPSGGGNNSYRVNLYRVGTADGSGNSFNDYGDGVTFIWLNNGSGTKTTIYLELRSGYTMTGPITFKPMLSEPALNLSYDDYVPYAKSNKELTEDVETNASNINSVKRGVLKLNSYNNDQQLSPNTSYTIPNMNGVYLVFLTRSGNSNNCGVYLTQCHTNGSNVVLPLAAVTANGFSMSFSGTSLVIATGSAEPRVRFMQLTMSNY